MKLYKARTITQMPLVQFDLVHDSQDGTVPDNWSNDPLVVTHDQLTDPLDPNYISFEFGICHKQITAGQLQNRPQGEIDAQETLVEEAQAAGVGTAFELELNASFITYDGHKFPMTPGSRERYRAIFELNSGDHTLVTTTSDYTLLASNISAFKTAYQNIILNQSYSK